MDFLMKAFFGKK